MNLLMGFDALGFGFIVRLNFVGCYDFHVMWLFRVWFNALILGLSLCVVVALILFCFALGVCCFIGFWYVLKILDLGCYRLFVCLVSCLDLCYARFCMLPCVGI